MSPDDQLAPDPRFYELRDAAYSDLDLATRLVAADPSIIEARNSIGETAFHFLAIERCHEAVEWLLRHGSNVNTRNKFGATPLMEVAAIGDLEMCRFLIEHGADVRLRDDSGDAALAHAAGGSTELVRCLLEQLDPTEDINALFSDVTAWMALKEPGPATEMLRERGLINPWPDADGEG